VRSSGRTSRDGVAPLLQARHDWLDRKRRRTVSLALEPEPACVLELTSETIAYFSDHLYAPPAVAERSQPGFSRPQAKQGRREHLGLVFDICHQAVEFEDIPGALGALKASWDTSDEAAGRRRDTNSRSVS
jgi:hypothetical protein